MSNTEGRGPKVGRSAPASAPTLRKLGADLRWLIEKSGINPERALVTISVPDEASYNKLANTFREEFDKTVMATVTTNIVTIHGVPVHVAINTKLAAISIAKPPSEPA